MNARTGITAAVAALALSFGAVTAASAATVTHTAPSTATHTATPAQQACTAFARWQQHPDTATLGRLAVAAAVLPKSYLKADIFQLAADASSPSPKARKYVSDDEQYAFSDCHNGYGA